MCVPGAQTVKITSRVCVCAKSWRFNNIKHKPLADQTKTPGFVHACRESREVALKQHDMAFGARFGRSIYFNYKTDTLQFCNEDALTNFTFWGIKEVEALKAEDTVQKIRLLIDLSGTCKLRYNFLGHYLVLETLEVDYADSQNKYRTARSWLFDEFQSGWEAYRRIYGSNSSRRFWPPHTTITLKGENLLLNGRTPGK